MASGDIDDIYSKAVLTVRAASALASQDVKFHSSVDGNLKTAFESSGQDLMSLANEIIKLSGISPPLEFGESFANSANSWKKVSSALDFYFEKADGLMDALRMNSQPKSALLNGQDDPDVSIVVTEKPQLKFQNPLDNADSRPFKPKIESKPHALKSLKESLLPLDNGSTPFFPHPYAHEIMTQPYPDRVLHVEEPEKSTDWNSTDAVWVDDKDTLLSMLQALKSSTEIAVDLEHHDLRSYYGITCLMQISSRSQDWIIDTLSLRDELVVLNEVFCDPSIIKVFHGANMDVIWLQRDLGLYVVSLFDTYFASKLLGFSKFSLAFLLEKFANFQTSKKYQLADWRIRPVPAVMMKYARADTHFLLNIFDHLRNMLVEKGKLQEVLYSSRKVACRRFEYHNFRSEQSENQISSFDDKDGSSWLMSQHNIPNEKRWLAEKLFRWRDSMARKNDESTRFVMPNHVFLSILSLDASITLNELKDFIPKKCTILKDNAEIIHQMIQSNRHNLDEVDSSVSSESHELLVDASAAKRIADGFQDLGKEISRSHELIHVTSRVLPAMASSNDFSIKFEVTDGPSAVTLEECEARVQKLGESFKPEIRVGSFNSSSPSSELDVEPEEETTGTIVNAEAPEQRPEETPLITLSTKKRPQKNASKRKAHKDEEPVLDYESNTVRILEDKGNEKKRRSYEPYNRTASSGPAPFKGRKLNPTGKSASFSRKRN